MTAKWEKAAVEFVPGSMYRDVASSLQPQAADAADEPGPADRQSNSRDDPHE